MVRLVALSMLIGLGFGGLFVESAQADLIAHWTFESSQPTTAGPHSAELGTGLASGFHTGAATFSSPVGNGSAESFSSNTWAPGDYYQLTVTTIGLTDLMLTFDQTGSNTGPGDFKVQTSLDNLIWTDLTTYAVLNTSWSSTTRSSASIFGPFSLPDGIKGVRLVDTSTRSTNGGTVATAGTSRVDNIVITGTLVATPIPEPSSLVLLGLGVLGQAGMARWRRWRAGLRTTR